MISVLPFDNLVGVLSSFTFSLAFIILFSIYYVRKYSNPAISIKTTNITAILSLVISLLTCSLLPIDIFIVSSMKYPNGTFKDYVANVTIRESLENQILYCYYVLYSIIFIFVFLIIPFVYFYFEENENSFFESNPTINALKYTFIFILLASFFLLIGAFLPLRPSPDANHNETWIDKFKDIINVLGKNRGEDAFSMVLSILTAIGVTHVAIYTAFGIFSWPISFIKGTKSARNQMQDIEDQHLNNTFNINSLREKLRTSGRLTDKEMKRLQKLEEQERINTLEEHYVNSYRNTVFYKLRFFFRPIQIFFGLMILLISILIWISLLITNIDKAFHSLGMKMGYALTNLTFPNPIDFILSGLQIVYPLDYILFLMLSFSLIMYTISGFRHIGLRFFFFKICKIGPKKTAPQTILILFGLVMLTILGINILFYSAFPQYATYGRQFYESSVDHSRKLCALDSPKDSCTMTRMSSLILRFFYKAWYFGAYYYWMMWIFLLVSLYSCVYVSLRPRKTITEGLLNEDFEDEEN